MLNINEKGINTVKSHVYKFNSETFGEYRLVMR